jgi:dolichyl-phosphate-mannose-protein mannosyltransferase
VWTAVYTLLAMFTRYWKIGWANYVVWDEVSSLTITTSDPR